MGDNQEINIVKRLQHLFLQYLGSDPMPQIQDEVRIDINNTVILQRGNMTESYPSDFSIEEKELIDFVKQYTMTSQERLVTLSRAVEYIIKQNVKGDIVECGVWRGGSMMLLAYKLVQLGCQDKNLFLIDTFEGMTEPTNSDIDHEGVDSIKLLESESDNKYSGSNVWCYSSINEVKENLSKTKYNPSKIHYLKGKVEETLPDDNIKEICLLRLDTDWYESTKHELETLYNKLVVGGVLIIDDYGHWLGAKKAVDEFFKKRKINMFLNRIDYTGRLGIKIEE